jgi:iduronate 2-sulfatase
MRIAALALLMGGLLAAAPQEKAPPKPNVLMIAIDDLRDWVRYLGCEQVRTPNLDRLAQRGVHFTRSYCAAPVCNPSRTALMSGLLPSTSGVYDNGTDWRKSIPDAVTIPQHFRKNGYFAAGCGKIFHEAYPRHSDWDEYMEKDGGDPKPKGNNDGVGGIKFAPLDCADEDLRDYRIVSYAIEQLNRKHEKPFFLSCGIHKPHMPWNVPRKYFEMYPLEKIVLPKVPENDLDDVPAEGVKMARPQGDHADILKSGRWKEAVQAYLATISYADFLIGRLIDGFDKSPYRDNTVVVLWSDHGWHLGEKQHWRKFALWEEATRSPLIWIVPGLTKPGGLCARTVDLMSIYPTLTELCGIPTPPHVEGVSIKSLLEKPDAAWDRPARTTYLFNNHAIRTEKWRYIRYHDGGEELYDEEKDPLEWVNLASKPESADVKAELSKWLPKTNKGEPKKGGKGK